MWRLSKIYCPISFASGFLYRRSFFQTSILKQNIANYAPTNLEKRFLVWTGKYKTIDEIPKLVSAEVMQRTRNTMRIRLANIMMLMTVVGCCIMVYSGKEAAKRGDSVVKQNLEWHASYNKASDNK